MLLKIVLIGKAQRVYATLSPEECSEYEAVKMAVLKTFEPEEYRQKFRDKKKEDEQSYEEFLRDKEGLLDKWFSAKDVRKDTENLRQLVLIEEFMNCMPEELIGLVSLFFNGISTRFKLF